MGKTVKKRIVRGPVAADRANENSEPRKSRSKGWLYDLLGEQPTMSQKLKDLKETSATSGGVVGTLFDDSYRYTSWLEVHRVLTERKLKSVAVEEAQRLSTSAFNPALLLDVREAQDYKEVHAERALNAPLFRLIQGNDMKANYRRLGYALLANFSGTERNPDFLQQALAAVGGNKRRTVLVICSRGGTLKTYVERKGPKAKKFEDPWLSFGISSRSLKACYELQQAGFTDVRHVEGGLSDWAYKGLPRFTDK